MQVMRFFRRLFSKKNQSNEAEATFEESEEAILEVLKKQYVVDLEENVESIGTILEDKNEDQPRGDIQPAPDYDESTAEPEDILKEDEMENFSEKNVVTHDSIEEMGNHLTTARIIGDLPEEVTFD